MPKMNVTIPHQLGKQVAADRLSHFLDRVRDKYQDQISDLHQTVDGDSLDFGFKTYGIDVRGRLTVSEDQLHLDGDLPIAAMMFKGKIESAIQAELEKLLA